MIFVFIDIICFYHFSYKWSTEQNSSLLSTTNWPCILFLNISLAAFACWTIVQWQFKYIYIYQCMQLKCGCAWKVILLYISLCYSSAACQWMYSHICRILCCCTEDVAVIWCWTDLGRMYQLVSHVADGLGKLKSLLEKHICNQGLSAIDKCGESALNVSDTVMFL